MARMMGRIGRSRFTCHCCDWGLSNGSIRASESRENRVLLAEATARMGRDNGVRHSLTDVCTDLGLAP